jgi:prefoldin subunit 5
MTNSNNPFGHGANATPQPTNEVLQLLHLQIQALAKQVDTLTQAQNILQKKVVHLEGLLNPNLHYLP